MLLSHASIRPQNLTADPGTGPTAEPDNRLCNLLRLPNPTHWAESCDHLQHLLRLALIKEIRASRARGHGIDRDTLGRKILAHDARHLLNGTFGRVVQEVCWLHGRGGTLSGGEKYNVGACRHMGGGFLPGH